MLDVLIRNQIPWSSVSIYQLSENGDKLELCSGLEKLIKDFNSSELLLYFNRNVNPFKFNIKEFHVVNSDNDNNESTEYIYQQMINDNSSTKNYLKKMTPDECKTVIADRVGETIKEYLPQRAKLVVGVSGGGDSNALLHGLSQLGESIEIHPVIIKGIPDWDKGVPRAIELCRHYHLPLRIFEESDVKALLGIPPDSEGLIERYERHFPGDDFEFLGTLLIRLALTKYAREIGSTFISTGLNLEDILCENMFRISNGLKPASGPTRNIGDITLVYPLWLCPKRIIDGCFPKYSLDNYDARYPCFSLGRNMYYSIVYTLQSTYPAFAEQLARGLSQLAEKDPVTYHLDEDLGFYVERLVPLKLRRQFHNMLKDTSGITVDTL
ncbi:hypothetical protein DF213_08670 [Dickeya dianthicola]|uniref:tRNA(Ile)-lysidine synthase TilS/MesJ n=1 Tax=Dickeya dianthicola TaxID=204039 RepID=A0AAX1C7S6_9GAMM|nr:hypothetical protein DF213_08670 [Dickeya dianthicola]